jgi:hypothetical protein
MLRLPGVPSAVVIGIPEECHFWTFCPEIGSPTDLVRQFLPTALK